MNSDSYSQPIDLSAIKSTIPTSPAFVIDATAINQALATLAAIKQQSDCKLLYSIKALPLSSVLETAKPWIDGFSASSLFEAKLASEILAGAGSIHVTTPGLRPDEWPELSQLASHISFNSLSQYQRFCKTAPSSLSLGLRLNPKLSFLNDDRFNPCRLHSKLGIDVDVFCQNQNLAGLQGLHFHTVFSATSFTPLLETLAKLRQQIDFSQLQWLNLGGGYLFERIDCQAFISLVQQLRTDFNLEVYIEPGKAIVGNAGYLIATVLDTFASDGKMIAVLDTSINHHPEVFEYQRQPELHEHDPSGEHVAILVGSTCLAGDLFGEYRFNQALRIGDKVIFKQVGAYTLIKANRFNGYPLPDIYSHDLGQITKIKHDSYQAYRQQWLADSINQPGEL